MKKTFTLLLLSLIMSSCSKQEFQNSTDSLKKADSLFNTAQNGLKTLDSISKKIKHDSIREKIIIPQIEKHSQKIDSTLKSGSWQIDSINREIEKITKNVKVGTDVAATIDSAGKAIHSGENAVTVITETAHKILKRTSSQATPKSGTEQHKKQPSYPNLKNSPQPEYIADPVVKTAELELEVGNLNDANRLLLQKFTANNAELVSQRFSDTESVQRTYLTAKVPLGQFERLLSDVNSSVGTVHSQIIQSEGTKYMPDQMCDVAITLVQRNQPAYSDSASGHNAGDTDSFAGRSSDAFLKGFDLLKKGVLVILPFWPLILIAGAVYYFFVKRKRKKSTRESVAHQERVDFQAKDESKILTDQQNQTVVNSDTDYSKYLPKK